eukprot:7106336-Alexandrium_andersonii.AAC.1
MEHAYAQWAEHVEREILGRHDIVGDGSCRHVGRGGAPRFRLKHVVCQRGDNHVKMDPSTLAMQTVAKWCSEFK